MPGTNPIYLRPVGSEDPRLSFDPSWTPDPEDARRFRQRKLDVPARETASPTMQYLVYRDDWE